MPWTSKVTAVLATAASLLFAYVGLSIVTGSALAFADIVEVVNNVRTATWKVTTIANLPQNRTATTSGIGMFLAPSHERLETFFQGTKSIQIMDGRKDKILNLIPSTKTAIVIELENLPPDRESPFGNSFKELRELVVKVQSDKTKKAERLGGETIDGRQAEGFRIQQGAAQITIWADPKTSLPVRVEWTMTAAPGGRTVMTDFRFDVDLDKSLFSFDVPSDYALQQTVELDLSKNPIYYLAEMLKLAAELNKGVFPPTLRGEDGIDGIMMREATTLAQKLAAQMAKKEGATLTDALKNTGLDLSMKLGATFGFLGTLSADDNDWHYAGKGVKLNTPNQPIFWFKPHKASTTYHLIYADLSIKEVPAAEVPKLVDEGSPKQ